MAIKSWRLMRRAEKIERLAALQLEVATLRAELWPHGEPQPVHAAMNRRPTLRGLELDDLQRLAALDGIP